MQRVSPLSIAACAVVGLAVGLLAQFARSTWGLAPLVPPVSLAATLAVIAVVLLVLGIALHRAVRHRERQVNPFHAVRLLAGARAGMFGGALFAGFAGGLALQLLSRSVPAPPSTWWPILLVLGAGIVLTVCGIIVERLCRIPPDEPEADGENDSAADLSPGAP